MSTPNPSPMNRGDVVFRCYQDRRLPWAGFLVAMVAFIIGLGRLSPAAWHSSSPLQRSITIGVLCFGCVGFLGGVLELFRPTVLFEVTDKGIVLNRAGNLLVRESLFIPWERIVAIHPESRVNPQQTGVPAAFTFTWAIPLDVVKDRTWPPAGVLSQPKNYPEEGTIYLSAWGSPRKAALYQTLVELRSQYSERR